MTPGSSRCRSWETTSHHGCGSTSMGRGSYGSRTGRAASVTTPMSAGQTQMAATQAIERESVVAGVRCPQIEDIKRARACRAELAIDHAAIRHNVGLIARLAGGARIIGVIKGDAYGLGAVEVAR